MQNQDSSSSIMCYLYSHVDRISQDIFNSWCKRMAPFMECNSKERIAFNADLNAAEKEYEKRMNIELNPNTE